MFNSINYYSYDRKQIINNDINEQSNLIIFIIKTIYQNNILRSIGVSILVFSVFVIRKKVITQSLKDNKKHIL